MTKTGVPAIVSAFAFFMVACNPAIQPKEEIEYQNREVKPSLATYTDTLTKLDKSAPGTIEHAVRLYGMLAPDDSTSADSSASALMRFVQEVVTRENDRFFKDTTDYLPLLDPASNTLTDKQKALKTNLHTNQLKLVSNGEGGVYLVPYYETILPALKSKTSAPVDTYLDLMAKEDTTPTILDAGIVIEMPELVDRLVTGEQLTTQKLPKRFKAEAARLNQFYLHALVMGADNTPVFDYETSLLNEEFKKAYDYLLAKYPSTQAASKINVWLAVVASGDKVKMDAYRKTMQ